MKYKNGDIVYHTLTNEPMMILVPVESTNQYLVRLTSYGEIFVNEFELQDQPKES